MFSQGTFNRATSVKDELDGRGGSPYSTTLLTNNTFCQSSSWPNLSYSPSESKRVLEIPRTFGAMAAL